MALRHPPGIAHVGILRTAPWKSYVIGAVFVALYSVALSFGLQTRGQPYAWALQEQKRIVREKAELAKDENMIKLFKLKKELAEKRLRLQGLLDSKKNQEKNAKADQAELEPMACLPLPPASHPARVQAQSRLPPLDAPNAPNVDVRLAAHPTAQSPELATLWR